MVGRVSSRRLGLGTTSRHRQQREHTRAHERQRLAIDLPNQVGHDAIREPWRPAELRLDVHEADVVGAVVAALVFNLCHTDLCGTSRISDPHR